MAPLFLLVHGTWAKGASWARRDGELAARLKAEFQGANVDTVDWSGANAFRARLAAADDIAKRAAHPDDAERPVVLIGHSHGGSAIVYALRHASLRGRVSGAVFLGTPFFALVPRGGYQELFRAGVLLALSIAFVGLAFALGYFANPRPWSVAPVRELSFLGLSGVGLVSAVWLGRRLMRRLEWLDRLWARSKDAADALGTVATPRVPALFLRTTGDEVALVLATIQVAALASNLASGVFAWFMDLLMRAATRAWHTQWSRVLVIVLAASLVLASTLTGVFVALFGASAFTIGDVLNPFSTLWNLEPTGVAWMDQPLEFIYRVALCVDVPLAALLALVSALLSLSVVLTWLLSTITLFAFGRFAPLQALMLEMAAEPTPHGSHPFVHVPWEERLDRRRSMHFGLKHSAPYGDEVAVAEVVRWTRELLAQKSRAE